MSNKIETKEIGIDTGIGIGAFVNTEYVNDTIQLKRKEGNINNKPVYEMEGYWESEIIDLVDNFREYDNVALAKTQEIKDIYSIETRVSDDGVNFEEYTATTPDGKIQSEMKRYIQIKINFFAGMTREDVEVASFNSLETVDKWENTDYIDTSNGLRLKRDYEFDMSVDTTWNDEGSLHRKPVKKSEWQKINSIGVV